MSENRCVCGQPVADRYLCQGCEIRLHNNLTELVDLNHELHTALTRMVRISEKAEGGKSAETALEFNQTAAERIRLTRATLVAWVKVIAADTGTPNPTGTSTRALVDWLTHQVPDLAVHREDAKAFADEVRDCRNQSQRIVDLPVNRTAYEVGPCPEDTTEGPCAGKVWAVVPRDETRRPRLECRGCRVTWFGEQWHNVGRRILARGGRVIPVNAEAVKELMGRIA